jgi:hypothetical protein
VPSLRIDESAETVFRSLLLCGSMPICGDEKIFGVTLRGILRQGPFVFIDLRAGLFLRDGIQRLI